MGCFIFIIYECYMRIHKKMLTGINFLGINTKSCVWNEIIFRFLQKTISIGQLSRSIKAYPT